MLNWLNRKYGWILKAYNSDVKVSPQGDIYLEYDVFIEKMIKYYNDNPEFVKQIESLTIRKEK
jgi:hypothetical protein